MFASKKKSPAIDPRFACFRMRTGASRIQGTGVFAVERVPSGRKVIEYTGERISRKEALARSRKIWSSRGPKRICVFHLNRYWCVDGAVGGSGAELINHCCDPNLATRKIYGHILYFSRRRIRPGEELTVDYRFSPKARKFPCKCGSPKCRGFMNRV